MNFTIGICHPRIYSGVEPEVLAKLILHKRERVSQSLPKTIEEVAIEKSTAEKLARQSRARKEEIEPKFNNLVKERQQILIEINELLESKDLTEADSDYNQMIERLSSADTGADEFNEQLALLIDKISSDIGEMDTLNHYESSIKANEALASINEEYTKAKNAWNENETHRRKLESKFTKMSSSLRDSNLAKDFWQEKLNSSLEDLLVDASALQKEENLVDKFCEKKRSISNNRRSLIC